MYDWSRVPRLDVCHHIQPSAAKQSKCWLAAGIGIAVTSKLWHIESRHPHVWAGAISDQSEKLKPNGIAVVWTEKSRSCSIAAYICSTNGILLYEWVWVGISLIRLRFGLVGIFIIMCGFEVPGALVFFPSTTPSRFSCFIMSAYTHFYRQKRTLRISMETFTS